MPSVAIVPAAGRAERFGGAKLAARLGGDTLLDCTLRSLLDGGADRVLVVRAPGADLGAARLLADPRVSQVVNPDPARGMFSSIQAGLAAAEGDPVLVLPADMPFVAAPTVAAVLAACARGKQIVVPVHDGTRGHPVAFPASIRPAVLRQPPESTLKAALAATGSATIELAVEDPGTLRDVDVPADLRPPHERAGVTYDHPVPSIFSRIAELKAAGRRHAVATVVRTQGSTPQVVGARLVVTDDETERPIGTLGGGCVEADAILASREILKGGGRSLRAHLLNEDLAWNTGLVCGGTMWVLAEPGEEALASGDRDCTAACARAAEGGPPLAIATLLERRGHDLVFVARIVVDAAGEAAGSLGDASLDARARSEALKHLPHGTSRLVGVGESHDLLVEPIIGRPKLVVAGGGHVAQAIARQARLLDFDVTILEDRPEFGNPERFGGARVLAGHIPATLATLEYGWNSFIVIATRGHKLDGDCLLSAVRTDARYIGLLGSRRKAALVAGMLREEGVPQDRIDAIRTPVGLDLGGRTPAEIALAVMAEITQARYGKGRD